MMCVWHVTICVQKEVKVCTRMCVRVCACLCAYVHMHVHVCVCNVHMRVCVCVHACVCVCICFNARAFIHWQKDVIIRRLREQFQEG